MNCELVGHQDKHDISARSYIYFKNKMLGDGHEGFVKTLDRYTGSTTYDHKNLIFFRDPILFVICTSKIINK
jgi:hypothetical protein